MSAIEKAAAMLRQEAEGLKACHTLGDDWCGDPAEADYHEMIAVAAAAIAERAELLEALQVMVRDYSAAHASCGDLEMSPALFQAQRAIDRATGEQP